MSDKNKNTFGINYKTALKERYSTTIANDILPENWRYADIHNQPGEKIAYIRLNQGASERPVIYIPGFTEGIVAKAPFAAEMAQIGFDVILPDQNRSGITKDPTKKEHSATYSQALNYLAIIEAEGIKNVDIVSHSYGSLILDTMVRIANRNGQHYFDESRVIMLAPAGFNNENFRDLSTRFLKSFKVEGRKQPITFPGQPEMLSAGIKNFKANLPRTVAEVHALLKTKVDYASLINRLGSLTVLSYADDRLYGEEVIFPNMENAVNHGVSWAIPVSLNGRYDGHKPSATHNDEQFNPSRVANSIAEILRAK